MTVAINLTGCTHSRVTYLPDGRVGYAISCHRWTSCLTKAGQLCRNKGYTLAYSDEVTGELIAGCKAGRPETP
jgi:hypothetical protein